MLVRKKYGCETEKMPELELCHRLRRGPAMAGNYELLLGRRLHAVILNKVKDLELKI